MKIILSFLVVVFMTAFVVQTTTRQTATVDKVQGINIFVCSKPVVKYDSLGKFDIKASSNKAALILTVDECQRKYPAADGIIFDLSMQHSQFIKLK